MSATVHRGPSAEPDAAIRQIVARQLNPHTVEAIAGSVWDCIQRGLLEENWHRFDDLDSWIWMQVTGLVLDRQVEEPYCSAVTQLLLATEGTPSLKYCTWDRVASWAREHEDREAASTLVRLWKSDGSVTWYPRTLNWALEHNFSSLVRDLLALEIRIPRRGLVKGFSPLTLLLKHGTADSAVRYIRTCLPADMERDSERRDPMGLAFSTRNDDLIEAMVKRTLAHRISIDPYWLKIALESGLEKTMIALIEGGVPLVHRDNTIGNSALVTALSLGGEMAARAVKAVARAPVTAPLGGNELLGRCGYELLRMRETTLFANLVAAKPSKAVVSELLMDAIWAKNEAAIDCCLAAGVSESHRVGGVYDYYSHAVAVGASDSVRSKLEHLRSSDEAAAAELSARRLLAHVWRMRGRTEVDGFRDDLEGFYSHHFYGPLVKALSSVRRQPGHSAHIGLLDEVEAMIVACEPNYDSIDKVELIRSGRPSLVHAGGAGHTVFGLFTGGTYLLCNKGAYSERPVEAFSFPAESMTDELYTEIQDRAVRDLASSMVFLKRFPIQRGHEKANDLSDLIERAWRGTESQRVGNCSLESLLTAVYAFIITRLVADRQLRPGSRKERRAIGEAYALFKEIRQTLMVQVLSDYLQSHAGRDDDRLLEVGLLKEIQEVADRYPAEWWGEHHIASLERSGVVFSLVKNDPSEWPTPVEAFGVLSPKD